MAMAMGLIGGVVSAIGSLMAAQAQANAANYNAQVAEINARTSVQQASADAKQKRREMARNLGTLSATAAANGVDMTGSVLDVAGDTFLEHELNVKNVAYQGHVKSTDYKNQAAGYRLEAENAMTMGSINALAGIVGGVGNALKLA